MHNPWQARGLRSAAALEQEQRQRSCLLSQASAFASLLGQPLEAGCLIEWGAPWGDGGRSMLISCLAQALRGLSGSASPWLLWVASQSQLRLYPPAWQACGLDLQRLRYACTTQPLLDLRPLFLEPFFTWMILDSPHPLETQACSYIARQARLLRQVIILIRPYPLRAEAGNPAARWRINARRLNPEYGVLTLIRGGPPRQITLPIARYLSDC